MIPHQKKIEILNETVKTFGRQQWFRDAAVHDQHPITGVPTLELKVNYRPIFGGVKKEISEFAVKHNLTEYFVIVDANGKPIE